MNYRTIAMARDASDENHHPDNSSPVRTSTAPDHHGDEDGDLGGNSVDYNAPSTTKKSPVTSAQSFTPRSLLVGLLIGTLIIFSNTYFGLQTGWISTMSMPSALIGFAAFKTVSKHLSFPFTPVENVLIQTVAGAVGTMPLGCGFVGVIPALEYLLREGEDGPSGDGGTGEGGPLRVGFWKLVIWSLGVCLFGVVFAVPLRKEVIVREKLKFPTGTATALMIKVLHGSSHADEKATSSPNRHVGLEHETENEALLAPEPPTPRVLQTERSAVGAKRDGRKDWKSKIRLLVGAFAASAFYVSVLIDHVNTFMLTTLDPVLLFHPSNSRSPDLWTSSGSQLAVDTQSFPGIRRPGHYYGPVHLNAHVGWCDLGMGNSLTPRQIPKLGTRAGG
jgi:hypothetical protein